MSDVSSTSSATSSAGLVGTGGGAMTQAFDTTMGKDQFLKLLMAQLQHQDPLNPMEDHAFVAQLATFSGLEQQMMTNQRLEDLQLSQLSASNAQLTGFIGKNVTAQGDVLTVTDAHTDPISLQINGNASNVDVTIRAPDGRVVKSVEYKNLTSGSHTLDWSAVDANGTKLPTGSYTVEVSATDSKGNPVAASPLVSGVVEKITFDRGYPELIVGGRRIVPANIISVETPTATPSPSSDGQPSNASPHVGASNFT